jgi:lysophospholipase L1-like esterase
MLLPAALVLFALAQPPAAPKPFEFKDGDRIVWLGNTLVEREQRYGYWETALLVANADKKITVRNLGWSGDTVFGDARAGFDNAAKGFERLVSLTLELKPTVIIISYGTNESFEGKDGLPKFEKGLEKLLDALKPAKARVVLMSPTPFEKGPGLPDPAPRNASLAFYRDAIKAVAKARNHAFVDLFERIKQAKFVPEALPLTDNGMHLTRWGYLLTAPFLVEEPMVGLWVDSVEGFEQLIKLRQAIVTKNELFFHKWRPQNETYLFGFRKHEQGKNAKEVAEFDPLVSKAEDEIEKIRKTLTK